MTASRRFLIFIPVETQRSRRAVVIGYYGFFIVLAILVAWFRGPTKLDRLLPVTFYFAALLGGLTVNGPVRLFSQWQRNIKNGSTYGLDPKRMHAISVAKGLPVPSSRYDEHDIASRDRAHYLAYSALRWPAIAFAMFGFLFFLDANPARLEHFLFFASVPFAILFFSLPQAILLWTEPDLEPDSPDPASQTVFKATS
jgi:hypothetical protein